MFVKLYQQNNNTQAGEDKFVFSGIIVNANEISHIIDNCKTPEITGFHWAKCKNPDLQILLYFIKDEDLKRLLEFN